MRAILITLAMVVVAGCLIVLMANSGAHNTASRAGMAGESVDS